MVKTLTVYKASAGSGKTFTLAVEYIKLLVLNPNSYRNILAVTFTNKATEEMKMRILSQLYGISKGLDDSKSYTERILALTGLPLQTIKERAGIALHLLLHNYNYFRVETIDSFFQSVLRNLARELDLTANLRISLNDTQVEEQAVDQLIDSLTHTDVMLQWLLSYIMEKINDDHSWNIIGQVKQFGKTIFRDYYKANRKKLSSIIGQKGFIESYTKQLKELRSAALERMKAIGDEFFDILENEGLSIEQLAYGKTGVASFFTKLKNGQFDKSIESRRACDCREDPEKWYSKKSEQAEHIYAVAEASLIPLLRRAMEERPRQYKIYQSADLTLRHLSQLRLLGSIEQKVRDLNIEANRFLLSDTQQLLHDLISDSDSPFIFEKIGTQLEHVMIDEFQDTSTVQWQNFKVLLQECMSHEGSENLIVGDVKQSIYRWRSGDWRLLNAIDREFPHAEETVDIQPLKVNYRSSRNIINFNNAFFQAAAQHEYEKAENNDENNIGAKQLADAYADVTQEVPEGRKDSGYVNIRLLPNDDYQQHTMEAVADTIRQLQEQGANLNDIAILVRTNKFIPLIAAYFDENMPDVRIISDEAFRLDASISICLLIQALHLLTHPDDQLAKATIVKLYHHTVLGNPIAENELLIKDRELDSMLPEAYIGHMEELIRMPLYELTERLYSIFQLERLNEQSAYLCAFYDQLSQFTQDHTSDIDAFIREWEETICGKTIQSDGADGVRILSIHKSKGLEFTHVIIPFCDWKLEMPDVLWCKPTETPFDALPLAPIDYSANQMKETIYEHDYWDEHLQNTVDNLNLLYVAFTRAAQSLYVIGQRNAKNNRSVLIEEVLTELKLDGSSISGEGDEENELEFSYGSNESIIPTEQTKPISENVFLKPVIPVQVLLESFKGKTEFRQSNKSREFIEGDDEQQELSYIKMGSVLHEIFSTIRTTEDIEGALRQLQNDGVLYDDEVTATKLTDMLHQRLKDSRIKDWFSDRWKLFNECSILRLNEQGVVEERRPDRVMTDGKETHVVDFKFGRPKPEYQEQVREYMQLLQQMGHPNVKGWLWYVYSNKIEEVKE